MDSNLRDITLTVAFLILGAADRVRRDGLKVVPDEGVSTFEIDGCRLCGYPASVVSVGSYSTQRPQEGSRIPGWSPTSTPSWRSSPETTGGYPTTEAEILKE
jgi:hypothetical protein